MSNTRLWPWPDPNNHEIQMLSTKCRELEAVNKSQAEKIKRLQVAVREAEPHMDERYFNDEGEWIAQLIVNDCLKTGDMK